MKRFIPFLSFICLAFFGSAQCDDLFFSEYVEGYANNNALEIYNPTNAAINLGDYGIARFSNGATVAGETKAIGLPSEMIEAGDVFVVVVDQTDMSLFDSQLDKPVWNGFNVIDTLYDVVTGEVVLDSFGNVIVGPQYNENVSAIYGDVYNEQYDLQCKADAFLCPEYEINNAMYFNGNDAMALFKGSSVDSDGGNIIDVIGVIGEDPTVTLMQDAWVDEFGGWITKDKTIIRNFDVATGRSDFSEVVAALGGSFTGEGWSKYNKNDFSYLGIHNSVCNADPVPNQYSCSLGPLNTNDINLVSLNIFPNPNGIGTLQIEAEENVILVEIYDILGKRISSETRNNQSKEASIDLDGLNASTYLIKVHFPNNQFSVRTLVVE